MALVVFLRGVNVGGHRTFRPSLLASALGEYDVVNVGAAGTFVVRKPGSRARFRAELLRKLPFETEVVLCDGRDLLRFEMEDPFEAEPARTDVVRFVSVLSRAARVRASIPFALPSEGEWSLRVIASRKRFVFGLYRRHMKTIGHLGQLDGLLGAPVTTRSWNTITAVIGILKGQARRGRSSATPGTSSAGRSSPSACGSKLARCLERRIVGWWAGPFASHSRPWPPSS